MPKQTKAKQDSWSTFKWILTIVGVIIGGTGVYFTQYLWASARLAESNKDKICVVEKNVGSLSEDIKENDRQDRKVSDSVIEIKGDIKSIIRMLQEMKKDK